MNEPTIGCYGKFQNSLKAQRGCMSCNLTNGCMKNSVGVRSCYGDYNEKFHNSRLCAICLHVKWCKPAPKQQEEVKSQAMSSDAAMIMEDMANTFRERNAVYGDNYKMVGKLMAVLFPDGAPSEILHSDQFHLFELKLVKLSRFAISGLKHIDSIHDDGVYSAMIESILKNKEQKTNE